MAFIKRTSIFIVAVILIGALGIVPVFAAIDQPALDNIVQDCAAIKRSLVQLQHADSRTRTYLGSSYETINNTFISPLSVRLVKNNIVNPELLEIQTTFSETQAKFRSAYTDYMREFESLLNTNCSADPQGFYHHLEIVRERRTTLRKTVDELSDLAKRQLTTVQKLQEELE